jgi:hypothetical protein
VADARPLPLPPPPPPPPPPPSPPPAAAAAGAAGGGGGSALPPLLGFRPAPVFFFCSCLSSIDRATMMMPQT